MGINHHVNNQPQQSTSEELRQLYPRLDDEQLRQAEEHLDRYVELIVRIYERLRADPEAYSRFKALTDGGPPTTMKNERSNS